MLIPWGSEAAEQEKRGYSHAFSFYSSSLQAGQKSQSAFDEEESDEEFEEEDEGADPDSDEDELEDEGDLIFDVMTPPRIKKGS